MAQKVRYKDTVFVRFQPQAFNGADWVFVVPDTYSAYLETPEVTQLVPLPVSYGDDNYYYVEFYASPDTYSELKWGEAYYIAFYWEKKGVKLADRELVVIVPDV